MAEVREIVEGQTIQAVAALLALRPQWSDATTVVATVDVRLRPSGYRLAGVFETGAGSAVAVAGFREAFTLAWGHTMYVDDVSTVPDARGRGYADMALDWLEEEARRLGCAELHLDSGVGADRAAAHRLYMRRHLRISSHHFSKAL